MADEKAVDAPKAAPTCSNCGQPATWVEKGEGYVPDYFCDACADAAYPDHEPLQAVG